MRPSGSEIREDDTVREGDMRRRMRPEPPHQQRARMPASRLKRQRYIPRMSRMRGRSLLRKKGCRRQELLPRDGFVSLRVDLNAAHHRAGRCHQSIASRRLGRNADKHRLVSQFWELVGYNRGRGDAGTISDVHGAVGFPTRWDVNGSHVQRFRRLFNRE